MKPSLKEQIVNTFKSQGNKTAFVSELDSLTYKELFEEALKLSGLIEENKLPASTFLSLEVRKNKDFLIALVASILNDLVLIPLKYDLKEEERVASFSITFPEYSLRRNNYWDLQKTEIKKPSEFDMLIKEGGFVRPTSGTTNTSKGVYISSSSAFYRVEIAIEALEVSKDSTVLCLMSYPFHFIASLISFLSVGATILTPDSFDENSIRLICKRNNPTHIYASPYHYAILSEMDLTEELSETKLLVSTGTKLPDLTRNKFDKKYFKEITEIFGIIEIGLALKSSGNENSLTPISQIEAKRSQEAELLLKSEGMLDAYLSPFKTKSEILKDGWFNTGDLIEEIPGKGFKILGRTSSAMHIGAHKVFPEEIEDKIKQLEGVKEARVYGIPHDLFGSEIRAEVISCMPLDEREIISYLRKTLGSLKCPKKIDFVDSIELTSSGKIKRSQ